MAKETRRVRGSVTPWRGGWRARLSVDGERQSLGVWPTEEKAERVLAAAIAQNEERPAGQTLRMYGERWLDERETDGVHRSARKDRSRWKARVESATFIDTPVRLIDRGDVSRWVRDMLRDELARQTVANALNLLRVCLSFAVDDGLVKTNVAREVRVPKVASTEEGWTYLTAKEVDALLALPHRKRHVDAGLTHEQRAIFTVAIFTGLRAGEIWGLRWRDVLLDGDRRELVVRHSYDGPTKGGKVRRVPLLRQAHAALSLWRRQRPGVADALVFPADGGGCRHEGYEAGFARVRAELEIERRVRFHDLRHTCASHLVMGTWGPALRTDRVRVWMGHSSVLVTERYAHLAPESLHADAALIDGHKTDTGQKRPARKSAK